MNPLRRRVALVCLMLFFALGASTGVMGSEKYPSRQIEFVVPWPPGGATDISGRIFGNELSKILKVPVVPVNKGGAAGTVGGTYAAKAKKDGYTLLCGSQGWFFGSILLEGLVYDPIKDFVPIANVAVTPQALCVKKDSPIQSIEDFVDRAKKQPKMIPVGTAGIGSDGHFNLEVLLKATGIQVKHVPYKGVGEVPPALMGGHVELGIGTASAFLPFAKSGDIRVIAITGSVRMRDLPEVSTFSEKGIKGRFFDNWTGLFAPQGVPNNVVETLIEASEKVVKIKEYIENIEKTGGIVRSVSGVEFLKALEEDRKAVEPIARELGVKK